jgi:hypothetical protein
MPDTMIDRVARALCEAQGFTWEQAGDPMQSGSGEDERDGYVLLARAAIAALMEPTDGMVRAGVDYRLRTSLHGDNDWPTDTRRLLGVMLTAALEETPDA